MNKRQQAKQLSRSCLLDATVDLIRRKGIQGLSTAEVAAACSMSHGSVFAHFGTREALLQDAIGSEILRIAARMEAMLSVHAADPALSPSSGAPPSTGGVGRMLAHLLTVLSEEELFLSMLYRDFPFLPPIVQRRVAGMEAALRTPLYDALVAASQAVRPASDESGKQPVSEDHGITMGLDAFFAMLIRLMTLRELYGFEKSILSERRDDVTLLFHRLFPEPCNK